MSDPDNPKPRLIDVLTDVSIREGSQQRADLRGAPLAVKLELLKRIIGTGVRRIELTAFAPGPWFADSHELAEGAAGVPGHIVLRAIYFNTRGLQDLLHHPRLLREGIFYTAATSGYRLKNYGQRSCAHALEKMKRLLEAFRDNNLAFDTLVLSTAWGESGERRAPAQVVSYLERFLGSAARQGFPLRSLTLADTVGNADAAAVAELVAAVKTAWPRIRVRAHLHPRPGSADECVQAGLDSGVDHWEAAWGGLGGSPLASDAGGNLDIRILADAYRKRGLDHGLNLEAVGPLIEYVKEHTFRRVPQR